MKNENKNLQADMDKYYKAFMDLLEIVKKENPKYVEAFFEFFTETEKPGALDSKTKELISIALSVKSQCPYCIAFHTKRAIQLGATKEEIMESAFVATLMGGGPSIAHLRYVVDACEQFKAK